MKTLSPHSALAPRAARGLALIALALLFLLAAFQLAHPSATANPDLVDVWRSIAVGSLFLFFCLPGNRPQSGD